MYNIQATQLKDAGKKNEMFAMSGKQQAEYENRLKVEEGKRRKEAARLLKEKERVAREAAVQIEVQKKIAAEDKKKRGLVLFLFLCLLALVMI